MVFLNRKLCSRKPHEVVCHTPKRKAPGSNPGGNATSPKNGAFFDTESLVLFEVLLISTLAFCSILPPRFSSCLLIAVLKSSVFANQNVFFANRFFQPFLSLLIAANRGECSPVIVHFHFFHGFCFCVDGIAVHVIENLA